MASAVDWSLARSLWEQGCSGPEIAGRLGTSESSVYRVRHEQGWPTRQRTATTGRYVSPTNLTVRCAWCAGRYLLPGLDAARVCPHCGQPEPIV